MLRNYMEDAIDHFMPSVLEKYPDICKCEKCTLDIKAIALNGLKPMYTVTTNGSIFLKINELNNQFKIDIINEIMKAIEIVSKNPKHD